jgi:hypothetical protein
MSKLDEIFAVKVKPKELTNILVKELLADKSLLEQMIEYYERAKDPAKGTCLSALTEITKGNPKYVESHIEFIIQQINHKAPRVKWESSEIIANIAGTYSEQARKAIPLLLNNINDEGTVVKWSAGYALTEIAKNDLSTHKKLLPVFKEIIETEQNNGVKNIYVKAMKVIEKGKK